MLEPQTHTCSDSKVTVRHQNQGQTFEKPVFVFSDEEQFMSQGGVVCKTATYQKENCRNKEKSKHQLFLAHL